MVRIGIIVGSLAKHSINRKVAQVLPTLAPEGVEFEFLDYSELPLYTYDYDADYPVEAREWKQALESMDGFIIVTPEYSRSLPGALKNAIDFASRPWGTNSFAGKPVAIMGASIGASGTALAQQHLRNILAHLDAPTMGQPETFFHYNPAAFGEDGSLQDEAQIAVLTTFTNAAVAHVQLHAKDSVEA